jgi:transcriptional regulator with XRE-family HTH domain
VKEKPEVAVRFGRAVRKRRRAKGWTMDVLAEKARLHRTYLNELELGHHNPSLGVIERLALALGLTISELLEDV